MKKILLVIAIVFGALSTQAQRMDTNDIPQKVRDAFRQDYPTVEFPGWTKFGDIYITTFAFNGSVTIRYNTDGTLNHLEKSIETNAIPQSAKDYLAKNCPNDTVQFAFQIKDGNGVITYLTDFSYSDSKKISKYIFDANGNFIETRSW